MVLSPADLKTGTFKNSRLGCTCLLQCTVAECPGMLQAEGRGSGRTGITLGLRIRGSSMTEQNIGHEESRIDERLGRTAGRGQQGIGEGRGKVSVGLLRGGRGIRGGIGEELGRDWGGE